MAYKRSEEHTSELQSPVVISYAVFCLKKKKKKNNKNTNTLNTIKQNKCKYKYIYSILIIYTHINLIHILYFFIFFFFFNDPATTEIYTTTDTLSLHDALPISPLGGVHQAPDLGRGDAGGRPAV